MPCSTSSCGFSTFLSYDAAVFSTVQASYCSYCPSEVFARISCQFFRLVAFLFFLSFPFAASLNIRTPAITCRQMLRACLEVIPSLFFTSDIGIWMIITEVIHVDRGSSRARACCHVVIISAGSQALVLGVTDIDLHRTFQMDRADRWGHFIRSCSEEETMLPLPRNLYLKREVLELNF